jgi:predicted RND superfamily exporter protein
LDNLIQSSFWSFVTITPLIMLVCRSIFGGAVVMLPNALPVLVVFGGMGWLGVPVDIGSMMAASIALGVAVDDTIHYLTWYREGLNEYGERNAAIISAYRRCAPPTLQAALISGLGLAVFAFSTFTPTQRLGWLMMTILLAGVVAELIMLPAILAGPLGKAFKFRRREEPTAIPAPHIPHRKGELVSQT